MIANGVGEMSGFGEILSVEEIAAIVARIRELNP
jgi:mono/diheme cytochrome c family protein